MSNELQQQLQQEGYRLESLIASGRNYEIAFGYRIPDDRPVALKSIKLGSGESVSARTEALQREQQIAADVEGDGPIPELLDVLSVTPETDNESRPVLVYDYIDGETLEEVVQQSNGLSLERTRDVFRDIRPIVQNLHRRDILLRDLSPEHFIKSTDGLYFVGVGNLIGMEDEPIRDKMKYEQAAYTAPEIRTEYSGRTLLPEVDVYGIGALLSYLLTGDPARPVVENPLTEDAYRCLEDDMPVEVRSIIGKSLQPLAKHRFSSLSDIPELDTSVDVSDGELQHVELPEPFEGAKLQAPGKPGISENLSPGPLVGRSTEETGAEDNPGVSVGDRQKRGGLILLGVVVLVVLLAVLL